MQKWHEHPPAPDCSETGGCVQVLIVCVCSGRGGLFRTELGEPAGPPFVLAESLNYNQLQQHDLDGSEAILEFY